MVSVVLKRASLAAATAALTLAAASASAATPELLASPRLFLEPQVTQSMAGLFVATTILDLRTVQDHPVVRARRSYSVMTSLPVVEQMHGPQVPILRQTQTWQLSRSILLTFPLAITGRNLVTAEILGAGRLAVMPTGLAQGGVLTFTGAF